MSSDELKRRYGNYKPAAPNPDDERGNFHVQAPGFYNLVFGPDGKLVFALYDMPSPEPPRPLRYKPSLLAHRAR